MPVQLSWQSARLLTVWSWVRAPRWALLVTNSDSKKNLIYVLIVTRNQLHQLNWQSTVLMTRGSLVRFQYGAQLKSPNRQNNTCSSVGRARICVICINHLLRLTFPLLGRGRGFESRQVYQVSCPSWSKGADLRSAGLRSAWVQIPQIPLISLKQRFKKTLFMF